MQSVRWGILGAGQFAREHMAPAIHAARGADLVAVASRSASNCAPFQAFAPGCRAIEGYDELLASDDVDAVYIPLPNHMHIDWAIKALEAGKHVLVEKPVALKASQIDPLIAKRDATGLMATEAYMIVHHPQWQRTRSLVQDGALGPLRHISCSFSFDNRDQNNIRNRAETGGGALPDIGVYAIGSARYVTGLEGTDISSQIDFEAGVDVMSRFTARFGETSYSAYISTRMHPYQQVTFHGETGLIRLTAPFNPNVYDIARIELHSAEFEHRTERFPQANHYVLQVEAFCQSLRTGAPYPWSLEDAKGTQQMIDDVYAASK